MVNHPNRSKTPGPYSNPKPEAIIEARKNAGLTQLEAAKLVLVATITWKKWETGEYRMPAGLWKLFQIVTAPSRAKRMKDKDLSTPEAPAK